eukprot:6724806-Prymnesium_polylepis.1
MAYAWPHFDRRLEPRASRLERCPSSSPAVRLAGFRFWSLGAALRSKARLCGHVDRLLASLRRIHGDR